MQEINENLLDPPINTTTQDWINLLMCVKQKKHQTSSASSSYSCPTTSTTCDIYIDDPPPLLIFEITPDAILNHLPTIPL